MGIFSKLFRMFSSNIYFDPQKAKSIVMPIQLKGGKIKIESKVKVPENYAFILGSGGKCLDAFGTGEYYLTAATLPECCKRLKIHKTDKKGKIKKYFKADVYFMKLSSFELNMKTYSKAEMGNRASGIFRVGMTAKVHLKVADMKKYMQVLLDEYAYLRVGEAEKITLAYLSDFVLDVLYKFNFALSELVGCNKNVENKLKEEVGRRLAKTGLYLEDLTEIRYILPKRYQKEYEENLKKEQLAATGEVQQQEPQQPAEEKVEEKQDDAEQVKEQVGEEVALQQEPEVSQQEEQHPQKQQDDFDDYVPFGGIYIETDNQAISQKPERHEVEQKSPREQIEEQFVDLNLDNLYKYDKKGKRCKKCGYLNDENATICEVCQKEFD